MHIDINECDGINDCQQICTNTEGSFTCNCTGGFSLAQDERNCTGMKALLSACTACVHVQTIITLYFYYMLVEEPCQDSMCSDICGVINGTEECFCHLGFELSTPGGYQCIGMGTIHSNTYRLLLLSLYVYVNRSG